jgi:hypothetical protein
MTNSIIDPTLTAVLIATDRTSPSAGALSIVTAGDDDFVPAWQSLAGHHRLDLAIR